MGNDSTGQFYLVQFYVDGELRGLVPIWGNPSETSIGEAVEPPETENGFRLAPYKREKQETVKLQCPIPKELRCKTRKRYIKKLMGLGVPRNTAERWARAAQNAGCSYADAYIESWLWQVGYYSKLRIANGKENIYG